MKWLHQGKWMTGGFGLAVLLMGAVSLTSYQNAMRLVDSANQVKQTNGILNILTDLSITLAEAESRRWGYIFSGDRMEMNHYQAAIRDIDPLLQQLRQSLADTPVQQQRLDTLERLIIEQVDLLERSMLQRNRFIREAEPEDGRSELSLPAILSSADPLVVQSRQNQESIRQTIALLEAREEELLQLRVEQSQSNLRFRMLIEPLGTLLTFVILFGVYAQLYRQMVKRQEAETQQRTLAQEKELSQLKLQLFSMVSHEFRTPLSLILGSAQLLDETLKQQVEPTKLKNLYRIQSSAKMMTQLLSDILTLARADAGKLEYKPEWVEIQTFCLNLVEDFQLYGDSRRSLAFTQQGNCIRACVDEKLLYAILSNLLSNAIKFSPPDSSVDLILLCEPDAVLFQVKDQGIGIPPEDQPHLYDLFVRGSNAKAVMGTGLGLAVVKRCLDLHQGEISVESQVGVGTTFTVRIPQTKTVGSLQATQ
ncbi:sensor histidine kinase [Egbenema bharatensis]|uniref:sensor histidine kinase n=1 Tax=Egbenema bharatensis TaxID=3463334 RepID=UPI003A89F812